MRKKITLKVSPEFLRLLEKLEARYPCLSRDEIIEQTALYRLIIGPKANSKGRKFTWRS